MALQEIMSRHYLSEQTYFLPGLGEQVPGTDPCFWTKEFRLPAVFPRLPLASPKVTEFMVDSCFSYAFWFIRDVLRNTLGVCYCCLREFICSLITMVALMSLSLIHI